jgi:hypothetical protein
MFEWLFELMIFDLVIWRLVKGWFVSEVQKNSHCQLLEARSQKPVARIK